MLSDMCLICFTVALRELHALATKQFACPGDAGWPLGTLFPQAASKAEGGSFLNLRNVLLLSKPMCWFADLFKAYFKQARDELGVRLVGLLFEDGTKSKWWQVSAKYICLCAVFCFIFSFRHFLKENLWVKSWRIRWWLYVEWPLRMYTSSFPV